MSAAKSGPNLVPPRPHGLVANVDAALEQQILDVSERQREAHVHHHQADYLGRWVESIETGWVAWLSICGSFKPPTRLPSALPHYSDRAIGTYSRRPPCSTQLPWRSFSAAWLIPSMYSAPGVFWKAASCTPRLGNVQSGIRSRLPIRAFLDRPRRVDRAADAHPLVGSFLKGTPKTQAHIFPGCLGIRRR